MTRKPMKKGTAFDYRAGPNFSGRLGWFKNNRGFIEVGPVKGDWKPLWRGYYQTSTSIAISLLPNQVDLELL